MTHQIPGSRSTRQVQPYGDPGRASEQGIPSRPSWEKSQTQARSDAEQFWIIQHGIKMTGIPAFGPTHEETPLWGLVAFIRKLPGLSAEDYQAMVTAAGLGEPPNMHVHDNGHVDGLIDGHGHADDFSNNHQH